MDILTRQQRSTVMSRIRGKNTVPEMVVRRAAHSLGLRFRLHRKDLPGSPDLVFPGRRKALFVHGCFWHRHSGCRLAYTPKSNASFWEAKFGSNIVRDARVMDELRAAGWAPLIIWECETRRPGEVVSRLNDLLMMEAAQ